MREPRLVVLMFRALVLTTSEETKATHKESQDLSMYLPGEGGSPILKAEDKPYIPWEDSSQISSLPVNYVQCRNH